MVKTNPTAQQVRDVLNYDPDSGLFTWKRNRIGVSVTMTPGYVTRTGYLSICVYKKHMFAHRLAWMWIHGEYPTQDIDHLNGIRTDNRLSNLRIASRGVNMQNQKRARRNNKYSGLLGVSWHGQNGKWVARIQIDGKNYGLGLYDSAEQAHECYLTAKRLLHPGCTI